jgi:hypothetical protein
MHPALLAAFFSTAIGGVTTAFIKTPLSIEDYTKWLWLFLIFIFYRTKIMIDDLGWYADLKNDNVEPNPVDVAFAIVTWVGWFMMAAVMGVNLRAFTGFLVATFLVSSLWIYAANSATAAATDNTKKLWGYRLLRLKDKRHVLWLTINLIIIVGGLLCYFHAAGWQAGFASCVAFWSTNLQTWLSGNLFYVGISIIVLGFLVDVIMNHASFKAALKGAQKLT